MVKRTEGNVDDDSEVIDLNVQPKAGQERREERTEEPEIVASELPEIEPREAALERTEPGDDRQEERRTPAEEDDEVPRRRETRSRGESEETYSRRVQARINREQALTRRTQRQLDEQISVNDELRDRMARVERRQVANESNEESTKKLSELKTKIEAVKTKLLAAFEAGDTKLQFDLNIEMVGLETDRKMLEQRATDRAEAVRRQAAAPNQEETAATPAEQRIARSTSNWQTQNRKWWNLNKFSGIKKDAIELDKELRQEVSDGSLDMQEYSDEYFTELSTRLKDLYPDLDVRGPDGEAVEAESDDVDRDARNRDDDRDDDRGSRRGQDRDRPAPRRHAGGGMGTRDRSRAGGDALSLAKQGRVRLTEADYAQMREFGLNPNDPKQKRAFAIERMRTIVTSGKDDGRRGGGR